MKAIVRVHVNVGIVHSWITSEKDTCNASNFSQNEAPLQPIEDFFLCFGTAFASRTHT